MPTVGRLGVLVVLAMLALGLLAVPAAAEDRESKPAVVRGNEWHLRGTLSGGPAPLVFRYGRAGDAKLMCDWNGDGLDTPGVVRERDDGRWEWHLRNSRTGGPADITFVYGSRARLDVPICGDWNGDGTQTAGVVRHPPVDGPLWWHLRDEHAGGAADRVFAYGGVVRHNIPWVVTGDWSGDGVDTPGVVFFHDRLDWHLRDENAGGPADHVLRYGVGDRPPGGDNPIVGDWTGDGRHTPGVVRTQGEGPIHWLLKETLSGGTADIDFTYGRSQTDGPLAWR